MLGHAKAVLEQRAAERTYGIAEAELTPGAGLVAARAVGGSWNARKQDAAPWWAENRQGGVQHPGLDGLAPRAGRLEQVTKGCAGLRESAVRRPPVHRTNARSRAQCAGLPPAPSASNRAGTTSPSPDLGTMKTHETTRKLARRIENGTARILSATAARDRAGRWYVSFQVLVQRQTCRQAHLGVSTATGWLVSMSEFGTMLVVRRGGCTGGRTEYQPRGRSATHRPGCGSLQRKAARQLGPCDPVTQTMRAHIETGGDATQSRIGKSHARTAMDPPRQAAQGHHRTGATAHEVIVVETLNAAGMRARGGAHKRGLNPRPWRMLHSQRSGGCWAYKTRWYGLHLDGGRPVVSIKQDVLGVRWGESQASPLPSATYVCEHCGVVLDRDLNAATNLARLHETRTGERSPAGSGPVAGRGADRETEPAQAGDAGGP